VCPTDPSSFLYKAKLGTALVTSHIQQLLSLRTTAGTLAPAVLLHGIMLKERDKGTLASQMADVKETEIMLFQSLCGIKRLRENLMKDTCVSTDVDSNLLFLFSFYNVIWHNILGPICK
jgi:hypothetical protein